ncbi:MAG: L-arabinose isomerase family protein, partial [Planctomycetota bacterium]
MMSKAKIGLLVLYLKLYDEVCDSELTDKAKSFAGVIAGEYEKRDVEVVVSSPCRTEDEFKAAIKEFEQNKVDAIVTLHLAYSPSLESSDVVAGTDLPIVVLDTTPDFDFGFEQTADKIMFNHGIHGVQDFCNLMIRNGKDFILEAGHWQESDVMDRTVSAILGCRAAGKMRTAKVGIVGKPFKGMGDFSIPFEQMKRNIGIEVISATSEDIAAFVPDAGSEEVKNEIESDLKQFAKGEFTDEALAASETAGLGLRAWVEKEGLDALTLNFQDITGAPGLKVVPFLEISKLMSKGFGYGGEGDVLTAAFCGALSSVVQETTFTEMFCPDWKGNRIFMSHMGEVNIALTGEKPVLTTRPYPFSAAD